MILVLCINALLVTAAALLPNDWLMWNSYILYALQMLTMVPYLARRARYISDLFLPTFFVLVYASVNLTFGSFLVPREYGFEKQFVTSALEIRHYPIIVPYLLLANVVLFVLSARSFRQLAALQRPAGPEPGHTTWAGLFKLAFYLPAFVAISYLNPYNAFSFQLALLILHLTDPSLRRSWYRYIVHAAYLLVMVAFSYENKREIAMVLFLIIFVETYYARSRLRMYPGALLLYIGALGAFLGLILTASILRGYGDFPVASVFDALRYLPQYMTSELFVDGITDNLELNYNYAVTVISMDHGLRSLLPWQYGASLYKVFYLPIPRDLFEYKPVSMMQLFTQVYAPEWWAIEGSMPVIFSADMFLNFHLFGLLVYGLVWLGINRLFMIFNSVPTRSLLTDSCLFLSITVLMFARGSGLEMWLLYFFLAVPLLAVVRLVQNGVRAHVGHDTRWVV